MKPVGASEAITVACKVQVGNPDATEVKEFFGTTDFSSSTQTGATYDQQAASDLLTSSKIRTIEAEELFELQESAVSKLNKKQVCLAQIPISKMDRNM
jgi:hypothetical protein